MILVNSYKIQNKIDYISRRLSAHITVIAYVHRDSYKDLRELLIDIFRRLAKNTKYINTVSFGIVDVRSDDDFESLIKSRFTREDLPKIVIYRPGGSSVFEVDKIDFQKIKTAIDLALIY
ncbi:MAG TPA: hypothetical protein ENH53_02295 [Bacteroidetes bacterium]|nr:hypothetical protein [Bacteroidota bacterium]